MADSVKFKPFKQCVKSILQTGFEESKDECVTLDIVPTMQSITRDGKRYFRLPNSRVINDDGSQWGCYLWDGWLNEKLRREGKDHLIHNWND